jgi:hypothetical protein
MLVQPMLAQKLIASAAVNFRQCSRFHLTSHSSVAIPPEFKPPFFAARDHKNRGADFPDLLSGDANWRKQRATTS